MAILFVEVNEGTAAELQGAWENTSSRVYSFCSQVSCSTQGEKFLR